MLKIFGGAIALALSTLSASALAEDPGSPHALVDSARGAAGVNSAEPRAETDAQVAHPQHFLHWYGWQVLTADLTAASLLFTGVVLIPRSPTVPLVLGGGVFVLAPPAIHFAHGRVGAGLGSLGLRVGLPTLFGLMGRSSCNSRDPDEVYRPCLVVSELLYGIVGMVAASVIDAAALSTEELSSEGARTRMGLSPALSADGKHGELRFFGTF